MALRYLRCPCISGYAPSSQVSDATLGGLFFLCAFLLFVVWIAVLVKEAVQDWRNGRWAKRSPSALAEHCRHLLEVWKKEKSGRDAKIQELYNENRQKRYRWLIKKAAIYGSIPLALLFGGSPPGTILAYIFTGTSLEIYISILLCGIVHFFFDGWVFLWLSDLWLVTCSFVMHAHVLLALESDATWGIIRNAQFYAIFAAVMIGNVRITAIMAFINMLVTVINPFVRSGGFAVIDLTGIVDGFAITMLAGFFISQWLWNEAEARIGEMEANMTKATTQDLLDVMCDATVQLDEKLMLRTTSARLDALLLRSAPNPESRNFKDFLSAANVARFEDFMGSNSLVGKASTLHLDLTDSMGGTVATQIFHVTAHDPFTKELTHLVGVQEDEGFKRSAPENTGFEIHTTSLREQATNRDEVDQGSIASIRSWCSEQEASYVILTCDLQLKVVFESDQSRAIFGFASSQEPISTRFRDPEVVMEWLRNLYVRCSASSDDQQTASRREHLGEAAVDIPSTGMCHKVDVWCSFRKVYMGENHGSMVTSLTLHLLPPDEGKRKKKKQKGLRQLPSLELQPNIPHQEVHSDTDSNLSNEL